MRRSTLAAAVAVTVAMLGVAPAHAAATWLQPTAVDTEPAFTLGTPDAVVDGAGAVTAAYTGPTGLLVSEHSPGGFWTTPAPVSSSATGQPVLAENPTGDVALAEQSGGQIEAMVQPAGQPWPTGATLTDLGPGGGIPSVAIDGQGDVLVVWLLSGQTDVYTSLEVAYRPAGGAWQTSVLDGQTQAWTAVAPSVAFTAGGTATALWAAYLEPGRQVLDSATLTAAGGDWSQPDPVGTANFVDGAHLAINDSGAVSAAYIGYDASTKDTDILVADRTAGGTWNTDDLGSDNTDEGFDLAMDPAGDAALIWTNEVSAEGDGRPAGGTWGAPQTLSSAIGFMPDVVVSPTGTATADWVGEAFDGHHVLMSSTLSVGGIWTPATTLIDGPWVVNGQTVVDAGGDVDVVGENTDLMTYAKIISLPEDVAGPDLGDLSVPATGTVGVPVTMSVAAVDAWSGIATTTWNFGDGTSTPGQLVSHTYTAPGVYNVGVTSADTFDNASSTRATIRIAPPTVTPGSPTSHVATPLTLARVTQTHRRWREASHGRALTAALRRTPVGTRFGFTVNQAARVTLTFGQVLPGRRVHRRCEPPSPRNRRDPSCARTITRGSLTVHMTAAGRHVVRFSGIVGRRHLAAGRYTVTVRATGTGGSAQRRLHFTLA